VGYILQIEYRLQSIFLMIYDFVTAVTETKTRQDWFYPTWPRRPRYKNRL